MKDIQEEVLTLLNSIENTNAYTHKPFKEYNQDNPVIVFYEDENNPDVYLDNKEFTSQIYYGIDIYSKNPDTYSIRNQIDDLFTNYGFLRINSGRELKSQDYYTRSLIYKIII